MAILDNYMFWPLLAIFRLSSREIKVLLYTLCRHMVPLFIEVMAPRAHTMYIVGP